MCAENSTLNYLLFLFQLEGQRNSDVVGFSPSEMATILPCLNLIHWGYTINSGNLATVIDTLKFQSTVGLRKDAIMQIRDAFLTTDVGRWVADHPEVWFTLFPSLDVLKISATEVMDAIDYNADIRESISHLRRYLQECEEGLVVDPEDSKTYKVEDFVAAVTGQVVLEANLCVPYRKRQEFPENRKHAITNQIRVRRK